MKRCSNCSKYSAGQPLFCPHCGRSYNVRICPRGHVSRRAVQFCADCGSGDLSTPAPPLDAMALASDWFLRAVLALGAVTALLAVALGVVHAVDWSVLAAPALFLILVVGFLYWTTTLLPWPVRRIGRAAARSTMRAIGKRNRK